MAKKEWFNIALSIKTAYSLALYQEHPGSIDWGCRSTFSFFKVEQLYCVLNYHDQKIQWTLTHDIRKHWTAVSASLGHISSVYRDLHHWRSNQWPQIAEPKLYNWAINPYCTQVMPNELVMVIAQPINLNASWKLHMYTADET